ncbi:hypothetical protein [Sulfurimonas sp.]|uniref:hypothetical protein n=1 Tax=Sulfurimonas sp. TaxID=2022749 RepID=UPI0025E6D506|nr:hypothetical protein [Sulfurimonas sp.]
MSIENKIIVGVTSQKTGKIQINNKQDFINAFSDSYDIADIDPSLAVDFKAEIFNGIQKDEWYYIELSDDDKANLDVIIKEPRTLLTADESKTLSHIVYYTIENSTCNRANVEYITKKNIGTQFILESRRGNKYKYLEPNEKNLQISGNIRIKYHKDENRLYFKKNSDLKGFFDISATYEEATEKEVNDFKAYAIVNFTKDFKVGDRNKHKIKMILEEKAIYLTDSSKKTALKTYADKYELKMFNDDEILDVDSNKQLTDVVDLLLENFNEDPISKDPVRIQSKKPYTK